MSTPIALVDAKSKCAPWFIIPFPSSKPTRSVCPRGSTRSGKANQLWVESGVGSACSPLNKLSAAAIIRAGRRSLDIGEDTDGDLLLYNKNDRRQLIDRIAFRPNRVVAADGSIPHAERRQVPHVRDRARSLLVSTIQSLRMNRSVPKSA